MTLKEVIDTLEIKELVGELWGEIESGLNNNEMLISSEKSLVFKFAWLLHLKAEEKLSNVDFEIALYGVDFSDGKFLDLYFEIEIQGSNYKVGIEFKFPNKKVSNSGQTQVRQKIINDIKRLNHLVNENRIDLGIFLCATNEKYYSINKKRIEPHFETYHGVRYLSGDYFPINPKYSHNVQISSDIAFLWRNKEIINDNYFSFLEPIYIEKKDE
ncbi:hypothetical protein [Flavobacterium limnophilum]|uniref:hypothetical protein n=1 Tax=Flavobacterium limnophilum TaxID=3003262 RepID=UPI0022AC5A6D|nr:hypothetical protein [Flavobacterium limnophilum]